MHVKGWMDEEGVKWWLENVWNRRPGGNEKDRSMLVWDMFTSHLTPATKKRLAQIKTDQAVISGGLTLLVQPLDVCLNKPFKDHVCKKWNNWMVSGGNIFTKGGNMRPPQLDELANFILKAWEDIETSMVVRSFKKCGVSNAMDGTEDDYLFEDDPAEIENEEEADDTADPYDDCLTAISQDLFDELFKSDEEDEIFEGFDL